MMSKGAMNLQDSFLNQVRRENAEVKVLLVNGTALRGIVKGFDNFTVILNNRNGQHLIYKHAIAQLVSQRPTSARHEGDEDQKELTEIEGTDQPADNAPGEGQQQHQARRPEGHRGEGRPGQGRQGEGRQGESRRGDGRRQAEARQNEPRQSDTRQGDGEGKQKPRTDGFNKIDLSGVKLGEEKVSTQ